MRLFGEEADLVQVIWYSCIDEILLLIYFHENAPLLSMLFIVYRVVIVTGTATIVEIKRIIIMVIINLIMIIIISNDNLELFILTIQILAHKTGKWKVSKHNQCRYKSSEFCWSVYHSVVPNVLQKCCFCPRRKQKNNNNINSNNGRRKDAEFLPPYSLDICLLLASVC